MASQISHIIYAKKYFDSLELANFANLSAEEKLLMPSGKINKDEFILGCVFPDIRRIDKNIKRSDTHLKFAPLSLNFSGLTSFEAGWKFHLYCDMKREEILNKYNFYSSNEKSYMRGWAAKLLEDELIYDEYNNWEKIGSYFNNSPYENIEIGVTLETFKLWYAIIAKYIENKPSDKTMSIFLIKQFALADEVEKITSAVKKLRKNEKVVEILKKIKDQIV
ncbi:MAG: hypothetical protein Q7U36_02775 [bacterium]|nr:hypothetical protein [bacterium]